ncbi:MAG: hypothetical protein H6519_09840 [Microthrixaceae bacterium]|nr:hypothetical protein [Acidimicrobiales bacterium]MCB9404717.1 hypothetical protein [Microthrixaceae bacterium]
MTEIETSETVIAEALAVIDQALGTFQHRELVSADEVSDLLLDIRLLLVAAAAPLVTDDLIVDEIPVPTGV